MKWMTIAMKSRMRATAPIRTSSVQRRAVSDFGAENKDSGKSSIPIRHQRWLCLHSHHWPDQCPKFAALRIHYDRLQAAKENHVCYSCLKVAGMDHRAANCNGRKQWPKPDNGVHRTGFHHEMLHRTKPVQVGVALATHEREAILPVIAEYIKSLQKCIRFGRRSKACLNEPLLDLVLNC